MIATVNGAAGTIIVKRGGGVIKSIKGVSAGTSYTFKAQDGPDPAGNAQTLIGAAAIPVVAGTEYADPMNPIPFRDGLQFVVTGTPGEFVVHYE